MARTRTTQDRMAPPPTGSPPTDSATATPPARLRWLGLAAVCLSVLVIGLDSMVLMVALPTLAAQLHASSGDLEWIQDSYLLLLAGLMLPVGLLGDRLGRKRLLLVGLAFFGVASALSAQAGSPAGLVAMRALMGVGAAVIMPLTLSVVPAMFGPDERPRAIGVLAAGTAVGLPLGPIVGGVLLERFWWGSVFLINVPVVLVALLGVGLLVPESRDAAAPRLDLLGAALSAVGLVALVYAIIEAPSRGWTSGVALGFAAAGVALLAAFLAWQRRAAVPMAPLDLLRDRGFGLGTLIIAVVSFALFGVLFAIPQYLQQVGGASVLDAGLRLLPLMGMLLLGSLSSEKLTARWGVRWVAASAMVVMAMGLALLATLRVGSGYVPLAVGLGLIGLGLGGAVAPAMGAVLGALPPARAGAGSALNSALKQVAGALGVAVLGSVLATAYRASLAPALVGLPEPLAGRARAQLAGALAVAGRLGGPVGDRVGAAARVAFTHGMSVVMLVTAVAVLAAGAAALWLPARRVASASGSSADRRE